MAKLYNLARMYTDTTTTGSLHLTTAVPPFLTFAQAGVQDGDQVHYAINDFVNGGVEEGLGTFSAPATISRDTVFRSSGAGNTGKIALSGRAEVGISPAAEFFTPLDAAHGGTGVANNVASTLTIAGAFALTLTIGGVTSLTLPASGTLATLTGTEELTNKTLTAAVTKGVWTASGAWTVPAYTLAGTVSGGGNQINNVIIGAVNPLAGTFTGVTVTAAGGANDGITVIDSRGSGATAQFAANVGGLGSPGVLSAASFGFSIFVNGVTSALSFNSTGAATFPVSLSSTGNFAVNTNKFSVTAASGNTTIAGSLAVTGALSSASASIVDATGANQLSLQFGPGLGLVFSQTSSGGNFSINQQANASLVLATNNGGGTAVLNNAGDLSISGGLASAGNVAVNTNKFNITAASGNTTVAGTLYSAGVLTAGPTNLAPANASILFSINRNTAAPIQKPTGTVVDWIMQIQGANNEKPGITIDSFGAGNTSVFSVCTFRRANGTAALPTATQANDLVGVLGGIAYADTKFSLDQWQIRYYAAQTWTDTAWGTAIAFLVTPNGSTTVAEAVRIDQNQFVGFGTNAPQSRVHINANTTQNSAALGSGTYLQITAADTIAGSALFSGFGAGGSGGPGLVLSHAGGTAGSPSQTATTTLLGYVGARAYTNAGAYTSVGVQISFNTAEAQTAAAQGKYIDFFTVPIGSTTPAIAARLQASGGFSVGTQSDPGLGMIYTNAATFMNRSKTSWTNGAAAATGTLTNAPAAGNPTKWIPVDDNGTTRQIPAW